MTYCKTKRKKFSIRKREKISSSFINNIIALVLSYFIVTACTNGAYRVQVNVLFIIIGFFMCSCFGLRIVIKKLRQRKYLNSSLSEIDKMKGEEFEKYLQSFFEKQGWSVNLTSKSGDYGADLVMHKKVLDLKNGINMPETVIVQAKRYNKNIGIEAVQQIVGAMKYYGANRCAVATNQYFTPAAKNLAKANNVELWDRDYFWKIKKN